MRSALRMGILMAMALSTATFATAQGITDNVGTISGSIQMDAQSYTQDSVIGAPNVPEKVLSNTFANILYTRGKFTAGVRFESYQGPLLGIDPRYASSGSGTGVGMPYRFARYEDDNVDVTVGNFYEQFGSGMILRTYEERNLGFDNSIDGIRARFKPTEGLQLTGFVGRQRTFFDLSEGIMRGADVNVDLGTLAGGLLADGMQAQVGASMVSRFQADQNDFLKLPENVTAWSVRSNVLYEGFTLDLEYASKINDPGATNLNSFNPGNALYLATAYSGDGYGVNLAAKRIDNMDFRSDRTATGNFQTINFLPALTKQHTWRLITLYPYATQPTGEFALQGDIVFTIPKGSFLGDEETTFNINASLVHGLDTTHVDQYEYTSEFMWSNDIRDLYYRDINIEVSRKWGKKFKTTLAYINLDYNQDVVERRATPGELKYGIVNANFVVLELWYTPARGHSVRTEFQYMKVGYEDGIKAKSAQNGDWVMALVEYAVSPSWYFTVFNEYNYGNEDESLRTHYPNASVAYTKDALRIQGGYGRVRGGILCVGGICRPVPASNGFTLGMTYTF